MTSSKKGSEVQLTTHPKSQLSLSATSPEGSESATIKEGLAVTLQREALEAKLEAAEDEKLDDPPITFFSTTVAALEATLENESADDW
jgi:hypothetical protein